METAERKTKIHVSFSVAENVSSEKEEPADANERQNLARSRSLAPKEPKSTKEIHGEIEEVTGLIKSEHAHYTL